MLLILLALFLWMAFFLAARSVREIAFFIFSGLLDFFACLMAISRDDNVKELTRSFFFELLKALLAVFVTGIPAEYNLNWK